MDLRTQLAKEYRSDDAKVSVNGVTQVVQACAAAYSPNPIPSQNNHGVNTACGLTTDFPSMVSFNWNHEGQHLTLAQQEAVNPVNDIYADWEPIVRSSQSAAFFAANEIQSDMHFRVATQALSIHTGGTTPFNIWYHIGSGVWQFATVTARH
jgi:hypothetical protein